MSNTYRIMTIIFDKGKEPLRICVPGDSFDAVEDTDLHVLRVEFSQEFPVPEVSILIRGTPEQ